MTVIEKNPTNIPTTGTGGRAYDATLFEASAIARLAAAAGKSYGIGAIVITHGESDAGNAGYAAELYQLLSDYNTDLAAITGQATTAKIPMFVSQQNSVPAGTGSVSISALQVLKASADHPGEIVCTGPKYQYSYATDTDHVHLNAQEYERLGEKTAQVYFERVVARQRLAAAAADVGRGERQHRHRALPRAGAAAGVGRDVAAAARRDDPAVGAGRGFEVSVAGNRATIDSVEIVGARRGQDHVRNDLTAGEVTVGYAATAEGGTPPAAQPARWGHLRDSDPFVGAVTGSPQPNYCVAFQRVVP